jgi:hypothetical protein
MTMNRVWIEIVMLGTAIACALALLLATLGVAANAATDDAAARQEMSTQKTYEGMVTCSRCGAKHSASLGQTADVCVRVCVHGGANFSLVEANSAYLLEGDMSTLKRLAGQRVRVIGELNGKTIRVSSVTAAI